MPTLEILSLFLLSVGLKSQSFARYLRGAVNLLSI